MIYYAIYYALLTHACYIVLFCHGSTEEDHAQKTDKSSDGFTINDVVDINDRHYFNVFSMDARHQTIFSLLVSTCGYKPVFTDYLHDLRLIS